MANKKQSEERSKNINRRWFTLIKPLNRKVFVRLDEQIRRAEVKLENLKAERARGKEAKTTTERIRDIDGIPLKFDGYNTKVVTLQAVRSKNRNRYDAQEEVVLHWLKTNGYLPELCSVSMKGAC